MATTKKAVALPTEKEAKPVKAAAAKKAAVNAVAEMVSKAPAKASAKAPVAKKALVVDPAPAGKNAVSTVWHEVDPERRANYIEVAAFYIAERRGFAPGNPEQDYLEAAAEIDRMIAAGHFSK